MSHSIIPKHIAALKCVSCGKEYAAGEIDYTCLHCGPILGTLDVLYDYPSVAKNFTKAKLANERNFTHWRYLPILPIAMEKFISPLAVGGTPLYRPQQLESKWNLKELRIKDDGRNPTASLKDRASSIGLVKALEKDVTTVTAASCGNAAASWAAFTALAGLTNIIFVPYSAPRAKLAQLLLHGATVMRVKGSYDDAFDLCVEAAEKWGWYNRCTAINPYLGEGKKTAALEICEQMNWQVPDYVFVSVGDGCIIQGMWKGFQDFYRLQFIDRLPKIIGVQADGSAPLVRAWKNGAEQSKPLQPQTIADSIAVGVPRDQVKALRAVRESQGQFVAVTDEEILAAIATLAADVGVLAEPAGATALAGLHKLVNEGFCRATDRVVVMVTGHGLKDVDGIMQAVSQQANVVEKSLEDVTQALSHKSVEGNLSK